LSLRGTAFYVLGLLADVLEAREVIEECNWEPNEGPSYICFPRKLSSSGIFHLEYPESDLPIVEPGNILWDQEQMEDHKQVTREDEAENFVRLTGRLVNRITAQKVSEILSKYVQMMNSPEPQTQPVPESLKDPHTMYQVYKILGNFKIELRFRRLIHQVFRNVNLEELLEEFDRHLERKT